MAVAMRQSTTFYEVTASSSPLDATFSSTTLNDSLLFACGIIYNGSMNPPSATSFSDANAAGGWSNNATVTTTSYSNKQRITHGWRKQITGQASHWVRLTAGEYPCDEALCAVEVTGYDTSTPIDNQKTNQSQGTSITTGALTVGDGNKLYLGGISLEDTAGTWNLTWSGAAQTTAPTQYNRMDYLVSSGTQTYTCTITNSSRDWCTIVTAINEAPANVDPFSAAHSGVAPWSSIWRPARL